MMCEKCNKKEATVLFIEVKNKEKIESHLCEDCSQKSPTYIEKPSFTYSLQDYLTSFLEIVALKSREEEQNLKSIECDVCHINYSQFQKKTRFGCSNDYKVFKNLLIPLLKNIHVADLHTGKIPIMFEYRNKIASLKKDLKKAINNEFYEKAANIRDQIKIMEEKHKL